MNWTEKDTIETIVSAVVALIASLVALNWLL